MQMKVLNAAVTALLVMGLGVAAAAAPSFGSSLRKALHARQMDSGNEHIGPYNWSLPSTIQAGLVPKEASLFIGDSFAKFEGRSFEMKTAQVGYGVTEFLQLLYGEQTVLAKGRLATSRFSVADNYYGVRGVVKRPTPSDPSALSLQFEAIRPDTGTAVSGGSGADFAGTHNNVFSVNYEDRVANFYQFQYTDVETPEGDSAYVFNIGYGRDYDPSPYLKARLQYSLIGESYQDVGSSRQTDVRPVLYAGVAVVVTNYLNIEADLTAFPSGVPIAGGEFTPISGFALYNPGGVVNDLRTNFSAFGALRIVLHTKF